jgi:hypothetical protein
MEGWYCPKCLRVYSPMVSECRRCNILIEDQESQEKLKAIMQNEMLDKLYGNHGPSMEGK